MKNNPSASFHTVGSTLKPLAIAVVFACTAALNLGVVPEVQAQVSVSINLDGSIASQEWADPPGRVGRLSYLSGDVSFFGDGQEGWARAGP